MTDRTDVAQWDAFISEKTTDAVADFDFVPVPYRAKADRPDHEIDVGALHAAWASMTDVHSFNPMLRDFGVGRLQALRLAEPSMVRRVQDMSLEILLKAAAENSVPIMVFVNSAGCTQIHTGVVYSVLAQPNKLEIRDPGFSFLADMARVSQSWVVHKPIDPGRISTLEIYDANGKNVAILCGQRDPNVPQRTEWEALLEKLIDY